MAFEIDPILRYGEFAVRVRTGEGILGDGEHRASQCPVYTGITAGPTIDSRPYGMYNGRWVAFSRKVVEEEPEADQNP